MKKYKGVGLETLVKIQPRECITSVFIYLRAFDYVPSSVNSIFNSNPAEFIDAISRLWHDDSNKKELNTLFVVRFILSYPKILNGTPFPFPLYHTHHSRIGFAS